MSYIFARTLIVSLFVSSILACNTSVDPDGTIPGQRPPIPKAKLDALVNGTYQLAAIDYEDPNKERFVPTDEEKYVFSIPSLVNLQADLYCNEYTATTTWSPSGKLGITSGSTIVPCNGRAIKFMFYPNMYFDLVGNSTILLSDSRRTWTATFVRLVQYE